MRGAKTRKYHGPEFKAKVGLEAVRGVKTIDETGRERGVRPARAGRWKKEIREQASTLFEGRRGPEPVAAHREPELPYGGTGKLKMGLGRLKKSPGSTCRDPARVGRRRGCGGRCPAMRAGRRLARHGLCATKARAGR